MNKMLFKYKFLSYALIASSVLFLQGCFLFGKKGDPNSLESRINGSAGEIIPFEQVRSDYSQYVPSGMVVVPNGTFHMGQADEDVPATQINLNKQITISAFFMDQTEVTNNQYRLFTDVLLSYSEGRQSQGEELPQEYQEGVMDKLFLKNGTPVRPDSIKVMNEMYPDTTRWSTEYAHHMGDPLMEYYFMHPAFDDYPVVGVDWQAANFFCQWRTMHLNYYRHTVEGDPYPAPRFRLPTEAEWEYASRGGRDMAKYPWGSPYLRNTLGCMLANFKPGRGNYYDDGFAYTGPVAQYFPNDYGLYDMAGNVAEWVLDAYFESSVPIVWDLNPVYNPPITKAGKNDTNINNRRVIRGGSWKDIAYYCETGARTFQHWDSASTSIGFRCAMTYLGRSSGEEVDLGR
jgi:gliding motility-associated lipoprotein GldK